jgi:hypothetical protein
MFIKVYIHAQVFGRQRKLLFRYFPSVLQLYEGLICKFFALGFPINKKSHRLRSEEHAGHKPLLIILSPNTFLISSIHGYPFCMNSSEVLQFCWKNPIFVCHVLENGPSICSTYLSELLMS